MASRLASHQFDLIISGGGIVGFSLLNLIRKSPHLQKFRILLLEQGTKPSKITLPTLSGNKPDDPFGDNPLSDGSEYSNRVSSITRSSHQLLDKLGAWNKLSAHAKDVKAIRTWNYCYDDRAEFKQIRQPGVGPAGEGILFSVVENRRILEALLDNLNLNGGSDNPVLWHTNVEGIGLSLDDGLIEVVGKNNETGENFEYKTPLLVGCDGFKSTVRRFSGLRYFERSLNKSAIVGTVEVDQKFLGDLNDVAYQRFSVKNDTVAALLPLNDRYSSFVISSPTSFADHLCTLDERTFIDQLNQIFNEMEQPDNFLLKNIHDVANVALDSLGALTGRFLGLPSRRALTLDQSDFWAEVGDSPPKLKRLVTDSRASYPLFFGTTSPRMVGKLGQDPFNRIALIGDAAHRIHPLAGQGLNLGLMDAQVLFQQLESSLVNGENLFSAKDGFAIDRALHRFECQRQVSIVPMLAAIQAMPALFALSPSKALTMFDSCNLLKESAVRFAN